MGNTPLITAVLLLVVLAAIIFTITALITRKKK